MAKSLNETELSSAAGGTIDVAGSSGTIGGVKVTGGDYFVVKGTNAKGVEIKPRLFRKDGQGLAAARAFCAQTGINADLTDSAVTAAKGL